MTQLVWDQVGDRAYEFGLDKGVLFLQDGRAIPWNGLTSIVENSGSQTSPIYFDGMKVQDRVIRSDFSATMKAVTYPDEFVEVEGLGRVRNGVFVGEQMPQVFDLCYRTFVGNDLDGDAGYHLHIIYNLTAIPKEKTYASVSASPSLVEFEWDLYAVPDETPGFRPTAHLILDSREIDPWLLEDIELKLYGGQYDDPALLSLPELVEYMDTWYRWKVTDNGDGTYTLQSGRPGMLVFTGDNLEIFQALGVYVVDHGDGTFTIYDTYDIADIPQINIIDHGDGSWTAVTDHDALIAVTGDGEFNIFNANAVMTASDTYRLSNTEE